MPLYTHEGKRLSEIWYFYANIVGYVRFALLLATLLVADASVRLNSFGLAIFAVFCGYIGGWLLDWIDGPLARKYKQCTLFGAAFDWYCDLLSEAIVALWAAELKHWLSIWMFTIFALELGSALIDTNNVAVKYQWATFEPKGGLIYSILQIVYPNGHYSRTGTAAWILHGTWAFCHIILAQIPIDYVQTVYFLNLLSIILFPAAVAYLIHQIAYYIVLVAGWREPISKGTN